jgi:membrane protein
MRTVLAEARDRTPRFVRTPVAMLAQTFRLYVKDDGSSYAGAIAYYALFSLVPLALITLAVLGLVVSQQKIVEFVFDRLPLENTEETRQSVSDLVARSRQLSAAGITVSLVVLLWSASLMFAAVRRGLNATAGERHDPPFWHGKVIDFALMAGLGLLILLSVTMTAFTRIATERAMEFWGLSFDTSAFLQTASIALSALVTYAMFLMLYRAVPPRQSNWNRPIFGAAFATVLFEILKNTGAVFLARTSFSQDSAVFAGASALLVFLFWVWMSASILLLGSEFGRVVAERRARTGVAAGRGIAGRAAFWRRTRPVHR